MTAMRVALLLAVLVGALGAAPKKRLIDHQRCTSIGAGPKAMADGSTVATHNNDCQECDYRIARVPARDWPKGTLRPVHNTRNYYPRFLEEPGSKLDIHGPDYYPDATDFTQFNWTYTQPIGFIDQVEHTYAYIIGSYGIQNEKQLSFGESTCKARFFAKPVFAPGGRALLNIYTLSELGMERCATARCAIQTMGDLAVKFGFYGNGYDEDEDAAMEEAGEALVITDPYETWMFHLLPDDTGTSAVWVAKRVPDEHITAVANQFVITQINLDDKDNYMASTNIFEVAIRANIWTPASNIPFNFAQVYGAPITKEGFMVTRRIWRIFTLAAPSLLPVLSPYTDDFATFGFGPDGTEPYPFSIKPDEPLTVQDIMNINRDQFEGTRFDLTQGPAGGPYGDPMRWPPLSKYDDAVEGVSFEASVANDFERPLSLWRTSYSTIAQARAHLPDVVGALTWACMYAPHHGSFVPVYTNAPSTPSSLKFGTISKFDVRSNWWISCLISNYFSRWYTYTIGAIMGEQEAIEDDLFDAQEEIEKTATRLAGGKVLRTPTAAPSKKSSRSSRISSSSSSSSSSLVSKVEAAEASVVATVDATATAIAAASKPSRNRRQLADVKLESKDSAASYLGRYHEQAAAQIRDRWLDFFFDNIGRFRDMYEIVSPNVENFNDAYAYLGAPRWWFEQIGFWGPPGTPPPDEEKPIPIKPMTIPTMSSPEAYKAAYPNGYDEPYPWSPPLMKSTFGGYLSNSASSEVYVSIILAFFIGTTIGGSLMALCMKHAKGTSYLPIN